MWCECTCRFLCPPLAVGPSCKGQSVWEGMATLPVGQPEGHHSSWRGLRSEYHLKNQPNLITHLSLPLVIYLKRWLTRIGVSTAVQAHGCTAGGWSVDRRWVNQLGPFAWLAASETTSLRVLAGAKRGLRQLFLRPRTAVQCLAH